MWYCCYNNRWGELDGSSLGQHAHKTTHLSTTASILMLKYYMYKIHVLRRNSECEHVSPVTWISCHTYPGTLATHLCLSSLLPWSNTHDAQSSETEEAGACLCAVRRAHLHLRDSSSAAAVLRRVQSGSCDLMLIIATLRFAVSASAYITHWPRSGWTFIPIHRSTAATRWQAIAPSFQTIKRKRYRRDILSGLYRWNLSLYLLVAQHVKEAETAAQTSQPDLLSGSVNPLNYQVHLRVH